MANGERRPGARRCPLLAQSGLLDAANQCPLLGVERTSLGHSEMSAFDPKRTSGGRWRSAGTVAEALSVNAKRVVRKRPGRFYGAPRQFLAPILCFDVDL